MANIAKCSNPGLNKHLQNVMCFGRCTKGVNVTSSVHCVAHNSHKIHIHSKYIKIRAHHEHYISIKDCGGVA